MAQALWLTGEHWGERDFQQLRSMFVLPSQFQREHPDSVEGSCQKETRIPSLDCQQYPLAGWAARREGEGRVGRNLVGSQAMQCCCTSLPWGKELCWGALVGPHQPPVFAPLMPVHGLSSSSSPPTSWVSAAAAPCTTSSTSGISTLCPTYSGAPRPPSWPTCPSTCWQGGKHHLLGLWE